MPQRFLAALTGLLLFTLAAAAPARAQSPDEFMRQAVYRHTFASHTFRVSPKDFHFLVDNLVGVLAMASQPDFRRRHPRLAGFNPDQLGGTPGDFTIGVKQNQARVVMQWLGDKQLMYLAQVTMHKLGLSISGRVMALLELSYGDPLAHQLQAKLVVAFQPASAVLGAALKPVMGAFDQEMDRLGSRVLGLADDFLQVYQNEREGAFSRSGLLTRVAELNQQRLRLKQRVKGAAPAARQAQHGGMLWIMALGGGVLLLLVGYGIGFLWSDRSRSRREARLLRGLLRARREQEALDHQLARLLRKRGLDPAAHQAAWANHQRQSQELAERVEHLVARLRANGEAPDAR